MNKGLEALGRITGTQSLTMHEQDECLKTIEEELKRLEELEKAFDALSKENEKIMKELSKEIEKNRVLEIIFEAPYIVDLLFRKGELGKTASERYVWGTLSDKDVEKVKEFFCRWENAVEKSESIRTL